MKDKTYEGMTGEQKSRVHCKNLLSALLFSLAGVAGAADYYVSPAGCDAADGSAAKPWRTIQRAANAVKPGDVVTIRGGVYREWVKPVTAGREGAPITFQAAKGEKVVVTGADEVRGWKKRPDGLWSAKVPYDLCGGLNPFTDLIRGDWFNGNGKKHYLTRLTQNGKVLELHDRSILKIEVNPARDRNERWIVNLAGITVGDRTVAGASTVSRKGPKDAHPTKWGCEVGWVEDGHTCTYAGLDFSKTREISLHYSACVYPAFMELCDAAKPDQVLAKVKVTITGDWRKYTSTTVKLPESAAGMKQLLVRFRDANPPKPGKKRDDGFKLPVGHAVLLPGVTAGTILAAFEQDPNVAVPELVTRPSCFYSREPFCDYQTLRGITFENAGPNWAPPTCEQVGIVGTHWSRGWVIEDCVVHGSSCTGITLGKYGDEFDNNAESAAGYHRTIVLASQNGQERVGHHLVRRCRIYDCGQAGICGSLGAVFSTVENCEIFQCHWKKPFGGAEMAGIKIHGAVDFTVANCRIHHCGSAGGVWFDWMGQGARVVNNTLWANHQDFFFEVDHGPILVEGNDALSKHAVTAWSQSIAFVGNRMRGTMSFRDDSRCTPIFEPHTIKLHSLDTDVCTCGGHVFINNIMAHQPDFKRSSIPCRVEDCWMVPGEAWKVDEATGTLTLTPPAGSKRPEFKPVPGERLGTSYVIKQPFPVPTLTVPRR